MKKYKLKKDLPTIRAGATFKLDDKRGLVLLRGDRDTYGPFIPNVFVLYDKPVLDICPNILTDWFEEIPDQPKTVWDLKDGDECYYIDMESLDEIRKIFWGECPDLCESCLIYGELFLTEEEAKKELARRKAKVILERDTKGFKPNWGYKNDQDKYFVYFNCLENDLMIRREDFGNYGLIYFGNYQDAEASIKAHPEEWLCYLNIED